MRVREPHLIAQVRRPAHAEFRGAELSGESLVFDNNGSPDGGAQPEQTALETPVTDLCVQSCRVNGSVFGIPPYGAMTAWIASVASVSVSRSVPSWSNLVCVSKTR